MSATQKAFLPLTVDEFLEWGASEAGRYELVDGAARAMAPASITHGAIQAELGGLLRDHLRRHRPDCRVVVNPGVRPQWLGANNLRIPDLGVTCAPIRAGELILRDPVLLVEILSPSNQADTWSNVTAYMSITSLTDILVLSSTQVAVEVLRRDVDGRWPDRPRLVTSGDLSIDGLGFRTGLADIYAGTGLLG